MEKRLVKKSFIIFSLFFMLMNFMAVNVLSAQDRFWEESKIISDKNSKFPKAVSNADFCGIFWQEIDDSQAERNIYLSSKFYMGKGKWHSNLRFAGPFQIEGDTIPEIFSVAVNTSGVIKIAAFSTSKPIAIFTSTDNGRTFTEELLEQETSSYVGPRIYATNKDSFVIFATQSLNQQVSSNYRIMTSVCSDEGKWSKFKPFAPSAGKASPIISTLYAEKNSCMVIFQAYNVFNDRSNPNRSSRSNQLFLTTSYDNGNSWSSPVLISRCGQNYEKTQNQQASLIEYKGKLIIAWERTAAGNKSSDRRVLIYAGILDRALNTIVMFPKGLDFRVSSYDGNASKPNLFIYQGDLYLMWSDNRSGVYKVYMAKKDIDGPGWQEEPISTTKSNSLFAIPALTEKGKTLHIFWQEESSAETTRLRQLSPDSTVEKAIVKLTPSNRTTASKAKAVITLPKDTSGIKGYSYIWTRDENQQVPEEIAILPTQNSIDLEAPDDGKWFFKMKAMDGAGNWSEETVADFIKDTTPPEKPVINEILCDSEGFTESNSIEISWQEDPNEPISAYLYTLSKLDKKGRPAFQYSRKTKDRFIQLDDEENGDYELSVAAVDECGNISQRSTVGFKMNKYIPYTLVTSIATDVDESGNTTLTINGKGFASDGYITEIQIDRDLKEPYDKVDRLDRNEFVINSDTRISNVALGEEFEEGTYKISLVHSTRGVEKGATWNSSVKIDESGTVKAGDFSYVYKPEWEAVKQKRFSVQLGDIIFALLVTLGCLGILLSFFGIVQSAKDTSLLKREIDIIVKGESMSDKKGKLAKAKLLSRTNKNFISLKFKLGAFISILVVSVITLVSSILGFSNIKNQEKTLASELQNEVNLLMDSLSTGAKAYGFREDMKTDLKMLVDQSKSLKSANYATLTSFPQDESNTNINYIWASNEDMESLKEKANAQFISYGSTQLDIQEMKDISERYEKINEELTSPNGPISEITQARKIAVRNRDSNELKKLEERQSLIINELATKGTGSIPEFDNNKLNYKHTKYLFYKPILSNKGVIGNVLVEVSTVDLIKTIRNIRTRIIVITLIIAIIILGIGIVATMMFTNQIIKPIRMLRDFVNNITNTGSKEELFGNELKLNVNDEIGQLGDDVNDLNEELAIGAIQENFNYEGKIIQRALMPLDPLGKNKASVGHLEKPEFDFFVYYEGAKGVSGDYFDFKKLDNQYYAFIKCDVSGKATPASLITVEVASLFTDYFNTWTYKKNGVKDISNLVGKINDDIETKNFNGKFAAFTMGIFDSKNGDIYFCNAGDNVQHIYDASEKRLNTFKLKETPPAGPFATFMVDMKGGFPVEKVHLDKGDTMFLYTDGIEEAKRLFRDPVTGKKLIFTPGTNQVIVLTNEEKLKRAQLTDEEKRKMQQFGTDDNTGEDGEEMNPDRVTQIIEAVFSKGKYSLVKKANPVDDITDLHFDFDFSKCEGTPEEAVMALVCVEKVFRLYKDAETDERRHAIVDRKVDAFMEKCFVQYDEYCSKHAEHSKPAMQLEYMFYTNVKEDEQFDDLTLVALKMK